MSTPKKPPEGPQRTVSGAFKFGAPGSSLVPGPSISMPPPRVSIPVPGQSVPSIRVIADHGPIPSGMLPGSPSMPPRGSHPELAAVPRPSKWKWLLLAVICGAVGALVVVQIASIGSKTLGRAASSGAPGVFADRIDNQHFQRGNIHTHTTRSDGKQSPTEVAEWYRDHGYQFLAISDHDTLVNPEEVPGVERAGFVLIPAEEITSAGDGKPVHVNGLCIHQTMPSGQFDNARLALAEATRAIREQNGVVVVNHPNFRWGLSKSDVASVSGDYALEIWSGHPDVYTDGDAVHPSHEALWDELLARGRRVTGMAVDDMHTLVAENASSALPGRGFIATFGDETSRAAICQALVAGSYYASSGVLFRRIVVADAVMTVWVDDPNAVVAFVGDGGQVLATVKAEATDGGASASYTLRGGESYVRARAVVQGRGTAWTQAYRTMR